MNNLKWIILLLLPILLLTSPQHACSIEKDSLLNAEWDTIVRDARGQTVNMYMWGGNNGTNLYLDEWIAPRLRKKSGIDLRRVPVTDIRQVINKLLTEKKMGKNDGNIDIIWINGENFRLAKENNLLFGPFVSLLPSYIKYIDENAADLNFDFSYPTDGYEAPWGKAQFVFVYDNRRIPYPPGSVKELGQWAKEHPGRFTYPSPPDFTGSCFVRHVLLEEYDGYEKYLELREQGLLEEKNRLAWIFLNELEPYLWRKGTTYPDSVGILDQLYANGEVWITMNYNPQHALNQINNGFFPDTSRTFVLDGGTFSNTHYLAIPFNSANLEGAMVTIDLLLSPEAQLEKFKPSVWGDGMVVDVSRMNEEQRAILETIGLGDSVIPPAILRKHSVPEFSSKFIELIEKEWLENVAKK